jgi:hypothetical protein
MGRLPVAVCSLRFFEAKKSVRWSVVAFRLFFSNRGCGRARCRPFHLIFHF